MNHTYISGLFVYPGKVGGAEAYFNNLLAGFVEIGFQERIHLLLNQQLMDQYDPIIRKFQVDFIDMKQNRVIYDSSLPLMHRIPTKYKVIFSPNYVSTWGTLSGSRSYVTTIHDLQYQHFPQFFSAIKRKWLYWAHVNTLKVCKKVVCISEFVKNDICRVYGEKYRSKLEVLPNPIDFAKLDQVGKKTAFDYDFPYILSVAAHYPHKNTLTLVKAYQIFQQKFPKVRLVLTGQLSHKLVGGNYEAYGKELKASFEQNSHIIPTGYVADHDLAQLYQNSSFFVFPSLFEGFGMPPVEAMGLGKPVITSRRGSLEEVTLEKATYLNHPEDVEELAEKMIACYENLSGVSRKAEKLAPTIRSTYTKENVARSYAKLFDTL